MPELVRHHRLELLLAQTLDEGQSEQEHTASRPAAEDTAVRVLK